MSRVLVDTDALLFAVHQPGRLSPAARAALEVGTVLVSHASAWEIAIKYAKGKLRLDAPPPAWLAREMARHTLEWLPIGLEHVFTAAALPPHHSDPFDRLLIAQARIEGVAVVTTEGFFSLYGVDVVR